MKLSTDMLTHGVYLVTAFYERKPYGMAAAWATQVKSDQVLVSIGKQSVTRQAVLETRCFGFNILRRDQLDLARLFGMKSCRDVDKFAGLAFHRAQSGSPLLDDCAMAFDCSVETVYEHGSDRFIVGQIVFAELRSESFEPLIYHKGDYWPPS